MGEKEGRVREGGNLEKRTRDREGEGERERKREQTFMSEWVHLYVE